MKFLASFLFCGMGAVLGRKWKPGLLLANAAGKVESFGAEVEHF